MRQKEELQKEELKQKEEFKQKEKLKKKPELPKEEINKSPNKKIEKFRFIDDIEQEEDGETSLETIVAKDIKKKITMKEFKDSIEIEESSESDVEEISKTKDEIIHDLKEDLKIAINRLKKYKNIINLCQYFSKSLNKEIGKITKLNLTKISLDEKEIAIGKEKLSELTIEDEKGVELSKKLITIFKFMGFKDEELSILCSRNKPPLQKISDSKLNKIINLKTIEVKSIDSSKCEKLKKEISEI